jgi:hypothetical protein
MFRPPSLLPPRSFPPLASNSNVRAAVAFTSEQNAVRYLPAHRICWPSEWVIDGRGLSPPRSAALLAAPGLFLQVRSFGAAPHRVESKEELNRMATYCPRTGRRSAHHLPVSSALWRTGADQTAAQTRRLRIHRLGPTRRLIRELSGITNGCADNMSDTSEVPQLTDPLCATRKSAEVGQLRTHADQHLQGHSICNAAWV